MKQRECFEMDGNYKSASLYKKSLGKTITKMWLDMDGDSFIIKFSDNSNIQLIDMGQSCCEKRYMSLDGDDDLSYFVGAKLTGIDIKEVSDAVVPEEWSFHEVQFLEIQTSKGVITVSSHNLNDGNYSGFSIMVFRGE